MRFIRTYPVHFVGMVAIVLIIVGAALSAYVRTCATVCVWTEQTDAGSRNWRSVAISTDGLFLAAVPQSGYIYTSPDRGLHWVEHADAGSRSWSDIAVSSDGSHIIASTSDASLWVSEDSGTTWTEQDTHVPRSWDAVGVSPDGLHYFAVDGTGVWTRSLSEALWLKYVTTLSLSSNSDIAVSADGLHVLASSSSDFLFRSTDGGVFQWNDLAAPGSSPWQALSLSADGSKVALTDASGILYLSVDGGTTWQANETIGAGPWRSTARTGGRLVVAPESGYLRISDDDGATWTEHAGAGDHLWASVAISADGAWIIAAVDGGYVYVGETNMEPDAPSDLGPVAVVSSAPVNSTQPRFTFALRDSDTADTVRYQIQVSRHADFSDLAIEYTSGLLSQGNTSFVVGQEAGTGTYAVGSAGAVLSDDSYYWRVRAYDVDGAPSAYTAAAGGAVAFVVDTAAPVIQIVTPIPEYTYDHTPTFVFSSTEAGAIHYEGPCTSPLAAAVAGDNEVTYDELPSGQYDCEIAVMDAAGNESNELDLYFGTGTVARAASGGGSGSLSTNYVELIEDQQEREAEQTRQKAENQETEEQNKAVFRFTKPLRPGMRDAEVQELQRYLNTHGFPIAASGPGSAGFETPFYGPATRAAVLDFQEAHKPEILAPLGLSVGTGIFGQATLVYVNAHP